NCCRDSGGERARPIGQSHGGRVHEPRPRGRHLSAAAHRARGRDAGAAHRRGRDVCRRAGGTASEPAPRLTGRWRATFLPNMIGHFHPAPATFRLPCPGTSVSFPGTLVPFPGTDVPFPGTEAPFPGTEAPYPGTRRAFPGT